MSATHRPARSRLDRAAIAEGAAARWDRLHALEDAIDSACELAVQRGWKPDNTGDHTADRARWDRQAWSIYIREALAQAHRHGPDLASLRHDAERLDHLVACLS